MHTGRCNKELEFVPGSTGTWAWISAHISVVLVRYVLNAEQAPMRNPMPSTRQTDPAETTTPESLTESKGSPSTLTTAKKANAGQPCRRRHLDSAIKTLEDIESIVCPSQIASLGSKCMFSFLFHEKPSTKHGERIAYTPMYRVQTQILLRHRRSFFTL